MSPPPAARGRTALGRLVDALRRRLRPPPRGAQPATVPGLGSGEETALAAAAEPAAGPEPAPEPEPAPVAAAAPEAEPDADARFDAARERLRARIEPPEHDEAG